MSGLSEVLPSAFADMNWRGMSGRYPRFDSTLWSLVGGVSLCSSTVKDGSRPRAVGQFILLADQFRQGADAQNLQRNVGGGTL